MIIWNDAMMEFSKLNEILYKYLGKYDNKYSSVHIYPSAGSGSLLETRNIHVSERHKALKPYLA